MVKESAPSRQGRAKVPEICVPAAFAPGGGTPKEEGKSEKAKGKSRGKWNSGL
jgi:hypothetical protein